VAEKIRLPKGVFSLIDGVLSNVGWNKLRAVPAFYCAKPNLDNTRVESSLSGRVEFASILQDSFACWVSIGKPNFSDGLENLL
jgi:hypothetical protein